MQKINKSNNYKIITLSFFAISFILLIVGFLLFTSKTSIFMSNNVSATFDGSTNYDIATYADLCTFRDMVNNGTSFNGQTINLTTNITMDSEISWNPIGSYAPTRHFYGTFNGNGYNIDGLYMDITTVSRSWGLFGACNSATIKNLNLINSNIVVTDAIEVSENYFAVSYLCGCAQYTKFIDCSIKGSMNITIDNSDSHLSTVDALSVGPICGYYISHGNNIFLGCVANTNDTVNLTNYPALLYSGIAGGSGDYLYSCIVNSTVNISKSTNLASDSLTYKNFDYTNYNVINCVDNNIVTLSSSKSVNITLNGQNSIIAGELNLLLSGSTKNVYTQGFNNIFLTDFTSVSTTYSDSSMNSYFYGYRNGVLTDTLGLGSDATYKSKSDIEALNWNPSLYWDFDYAWGFVADGYDITNILPTGWAYPVPLQAVMSFTSFYSTIVDPVFDYSIDTDSELYILVHLTNCGINFLGMTINLTADLDVSAVSWEPISVVSYFSATFNGNSHTISGITMISGGYVNAGFVGSTVYSSFSNFYLTNVSYNFSSSITKHLGGLVLNVNLLILMIF